MVEALAARMFPVCDCYTGTACNYHTLVCGLDRLFGAIPRKLEIVIASAPFNIIDLCKAMDRKRRRLNARKKRRGNSR